MTEATETSERLEGHTGRPFRPVSCGQRLVECSIECWRGVGEVVRGGRWRWWRRSRGLSPESSSREVSIDFRPRSPPLTLHTTTVTTSTTSTTTIAVYQYMAILL